MVVSNIYIQYGEAGPTDIFSVGDNGTILHYDGQSWSQMESGTHKRLTGIWGSSPNDIYVVGFSGIIIHYDGIAWSSVGDPLITHNNNLYSVWGTPGVDVFVVGDSETILRYSEVGNVTQPEGPRPVLSFDFHNGSTLSAGQFFNINAWIYGARDQVLDFYFRFRMDDGNLYYFADGGTRLSGPNERLPFYSNQPITSDQSVYMLIWPVMVPEGAAGEYPLYFSVARPGSDEALSQAQAVLRIQP